MTTFTFSNCRLFEKCTIISGTIIHVGKIYNRTLNEIIKSDVLEMHLTRLIIVCAIIFLVIFDPTWVCKVTTKASKLLSFNIRIVVKLNFQLT